MAAKLGALPLILLAALAIRLPFLQPGGSRRRRHLPRRSVHALIDPLHPQDTTYVFQGRDVDLRGHSHPPLNGWILGGLLAVFGEPREVPFHTAYIAFSLVAVLSMWSLARRFSPQPLWAVLLFLAVPAFVVNGASLEADLPFLACWMAAIALFSAGRLAPAALALAAAALAAYQAVLLTPILMAYTWIYRRRNRAAWATTLIPIAALAAWQIFERLTRGAFPAAVLLGYLHQFQTPVNKWHSALALLVHSWFVIFPALVPGALWLAFRSRREPQTRFLLAWMAVFYAGALTVFFAGAARYLLPVAAPFALLASRLRVRWLGPGVALQLALALGLASVNYQHWDGYRRFAPTLPSGHRIWVDGEWGLRAFTTASMSTSLPEVVARVSINRGGSIGGTTRPAASSQRAALPHGVRASSFANVAHAPHWHPSHTGSSASPASPRSRRSHCSSVISSGVPGKLASQAS